MTKRVLQECKTLFKYMTLKEYHNDVISRLSDIYPGAEAAEIAYRLFDFYLKASKLDIALKAKDSIEKCKALEAAIERLLQNEPLQYVTGVADFYDLEFGVNSDVLIPRPETEELVKLILDNHKGEFSLLDVGTGSGCIPSAIKSNSPKAIIAGCDVSLKALKVAKKNADKNRLELNFFYCDILDKAHWPQAQYNVIVSNPPYVLEREKGLMRKNVLDYEPHLALFVDDKKPLLFYKAIADFATSHLYKDGKLYFEINEAYGILTKEMLINKGFNDVIIHSDIFGKDRMISAKF